jgi:HSP20 family molecular chaperone IbpA
MERKKKRRVPKTHFDVDLKAGKPDLGAILKEINRMIDSAARSPRKRKSGFTRTGEIKGVGTKKLKAIYGFSVELEKSRFRPPRIRLLEKADKIVITAPIPGAKKQNINVGLKNRILQLTAGDSGRKYHKKIPLPSRVNKRMLRSTYRNGVLKITLAKAKK